MQFHAVIVCEIHPCFVRVVRGMPEDQSLFHLQIQQQLPQVLRLQTEQCLQTLREQRRREIAVSLLHGEAQHIEHRAPDSGLRVRTDAHAPRDFIRGLKTHAAQIVRDSIGVLAEQGVDLIAVAPVNLDGEVHPYAVAGEKEHGAAQFPLLLNLPRNFHRKALADALHLRKALGFLFENAKRVVLKLFDDALRECLAHSFDSAGGQVALHTRTVLRRLDFVCLDRQLFAVGRMKLKMTLCADVLPLRNHRKGSDQHIVLAAALHAENRIAILLVPVLDFLNKAAQRVHPVNTPSLRLRCRRSGTR